MGKMGGGGKAEIVWKNKVDWIWWVIKKKRKLCQVKKLCGDMRIIVDGCKTNQS